MIKSFKSLVFLVAINSIMLNNFSSNIIKIPTFYFIGSLLGKFSAATAKDLESEKNHEFKFLIDAFNENIVNPYKKFNLKDEYMDIVFQGLKIHILSSIFGVKKHVGKLSFMYQFYKNLEGTSLKIKINKELGEALNKSKELLGISDETISNTSEKINLLKDLLSSLLFI